MFATGAQPHHAARAPPFHLSPKAATMPDHLETTTRRTQSFKLGNGQLVQIHSLGVHDYVAAREECLRQYRRSQIKTWTENADLLADVDPELKINLIRDAMDRAAKITLEDLPTKTIAIPLMNNGSPIRDPKTKQIKTKQQQVEYAAWWMSETPEGKLFMTWRSMRYSNPEMTIDDAEQIFSEAINELDTVADEVGELSTPKLGKSSAPAATGATATETEQAEAESKRKARRRRRPTGR